VCVYVSNANLPVAKTHTLVTVVMGMRVRVIDGRDDDGCACTLLLLLLLSALQRRRVYRDRGRSRFGNSGDKCLSEISETARRTDEGE